MGLALSILPLIGELLHNRSTSPPYRNAAVREANTTENSIQMPPPPKFLLHAKGRYPLPVLASIPRDIDFKTKICR